MGFDSFGLPAEQYAVQTGTHPRTTTDANIEAVPRTDPPAGAWATTASSCRHHRRRVLPLDAVDLPADHNAWFDPDADGATGSGGKARPIAELIAEFGLAGTRTLDDGRSWSELAAAEKARRRRSSARLSQQRGSGQLVPGLGTVLANREVTADGRSERSNFPVFRKNLRQWMMRITAYSDRLLDDLDLLDWPEKVRDDAAQLDRALARCTSISRCPFVTARRVFTTARHPVRRLTWSWLPSTSSSTRSSPTRGLPGSMSDGPVALRPGQAVAAYRASIAASRTWSARRTRRRPVFFTGALRDNPVNGEQILVFIADYVLIGYGTGAIMAVPATMPVTTNSRRPSACRSARSSAQAGHRRIGVDRRRPLVNSGFLDGLPVGEAKAQIVAKLEADGSGIRDGPAQSCVTGCSPVSATGEPFPIVYDADGNAHPLPESMLPVELPEVEDYAPVAFDPDDADSGPSPARRPPSGRGSSWTWAMGCRPTPAT